MREAIDGTMRPSAQMFIDGLYQSRLALAAVLIGIVRPRARGTAFPIVIAARPSMMAAKAARKMNLIIFLRGSRPSASRSTELLDHGLSWVDCPFATPTRLTSLLGKIILDFVIRLMRETDKKVSGRHMVTSSIAIAANRPLLRPPRSLSIGAFWPQFG
jgi:hypothetical protein